MCDVVEVDELIEERAKQIDSNLPTTGAQQVNLELSFFEKRTKKAWFITKSEEEICWEKWQVKIMVANERMMDSVIEGNLSKALMQIITACSGDLDKTTIPPIISTNSNPFPYTIEYSIGEVD